MEERSILGLDGLLGRISQAFVNVFEKTGTVDEGPVIDPLGGGSQSTPTSTVDEGPVIDPLGGGSHN